MKGVVVVSRTKPTLPRTKQSEAKLRARIQRAFSQASGGRTAVFSKRIEDELLELMKQYVVATKDQRELVYRKGEERILRALRSKRA
jgi:hypothetical protein